MRYLILVKVTDTEAGLPPEPSFAATMADYHETLARAGVLLDASLLEDSAAGFRIRYHDGRRSVIDGPFVPGSGLVAGYTLIQVQSREEALEWAKRFPAPHGDARDGEIEVRPLRASGGSAV